MSKPSVPMQSLFLSAPAEILTSDRKEISGQLKRLEHEMKRADEWLSSQ